MWATVTSHNIMWQHHIVSAQGLSKLTNICRNRMMDGHSSHISPKSFHTVTSDCTTCPFLDLSQMPRLEWSWSQFHLKTQCQAKESTTRSPTSGAFHAQTSFLIQLAIFKLKLLTSHVFVFARYASGGKAFALQVLLTRNLFSFSMHSGLHVGNIKRTFTAKTSGPNVWDTHLLTILYYEKC